MRPIRHRLALFLLFLLATSSSRAEDLTKFRLDFAWSLVGASTWHDNLAAADPDGDSRLELLAISDLSGGYWYQLQLDDYLQHEAASLPGDDGLAKIVPVPRAGTTDLLLVWPNRIEVLDGKSRILLRTITTQVDPLVAAAVADLDGDGDLEIVVCGESDLETRNYANGALVKTAIGRGGDNVSIGQIDADAQLEIAILEGPSGSAVLDSKTLTADWTLPVSIYNDVRLADLDADGKDEVVWAISGVFAWNPRTNLSHFSHPGLSPQLIDFADLDGNGSTEVVVADSNNRVDVLNGVSGQTLWTLQIPALESQCCTGIAIGNLDQDPALEIALKAPGGSGTPGPLVIVDADTHLLQYTDRRFGPEFPALASGDLDADGTAELVVGSSRSGFFGPGRFLVFDEGSRRIELESASWSGANSSSLSNAVIAQLDGDAAQELCLAGTVSFDYVLIRCLDGETFVEQWRRELPGDRSAGHLLAADLDQNGDPEILVSTASGVPRSVYALDGSSGQILWQSEDFDLNLWEPGPMRVGDVTGNSSLEIVLLFPRSGVAILDAATGATLHGPHALSAGVAELAQFDLDAQLEILVEADCATVKPMNPATGALGVSHFSVPGCLEAMRVHDLTRDGVPDFAFAYSTKVRVVDGQSKTLAWESPELTSNLGSPDALLAADLDGNTVPELVIGSSLGFFVVESPLQKIFSSGFESGTTGWTVPF